jgi:hypothetical protein
MAVRNPASPSQGEKDQHSEASTTGTLPQSHNQMPTTASLRKTVAKFLEVVPRSTS